MPTKSLVRFVSCLMIVVAAMSPTAYAQAQGKPSATASFEGHAIDLSGDWGAARACIVDDASARCYRSQRALLKAEQPPLSEIQPLTTLANCATPLTLYSSTGFGGSTLNLAARGVLIDLSVYGFNNVTSSYAIGACSARFYDTTSGGTQYPGSTGAGASASSMLSGWDNRVGSVLIP